MAQIHNLYKLIILYLLDICDAPLSGMIISEFFLEYNYTTYISARNALGELTDSNFVSLNTTYNDSQYSITESGREILTYLSERISDETKAEAKAYLSSLDISSKPDHLLEADYTKSVNGNYEAICKIISADKQILSLTLSVPSSKAAQTICENWKDTSSDIYYTLMDMLLK